MATKFEFDEELKNGTAKNGNGIAAVLAPDVAQTLQDASVQAIYAELLKRIGEDPTRNGLQETPKRMEKSMAFLTQGYQQTVESVLHGALFDVDYDEMVIVRDIEFYSLCEHHLLPFFGKAHIAYVPQGKVVGLSKLPRIVDVFARRLQVQERLTQQIAEAIEEAIQPQGVGVVIEAQHLCMMMRGVEKQSSLTVTSSLRGVFKTQLQTRSEFLELVQARR
jgi:GTP cyclohydrolase IA